jgi:hypothetical protein
VTLWRRLFTHHWSVEKALSTPIDTRFVKQSA